MVTTRRVIRPQPPCGCSYLINGGRDRALCIVTDLYEAGEVELFFVPPRATSADYFVVCPYGAPGEIRWVRETWAKVYKGEPPYDDDSEYVIEYRADTGNKYPGQWPEECKDDELCGRWKPSTQMPRLHSRLSVLCKGMGVERLQDISEEDAIASGLKEYFWPDDLPDEVKARVGSVRHWEHTESGRKKARGVWDCPIKAYRWLWDSINAKRGYSWGINPWIWVVEFKDVSDE